MTKQRLGPPSGSRDFLPDEALFRQRVLETVRAAFVRHGFAPIETPAFERLETLSGKYGDEGEKLIFKILKRGDKAASGEADLALRYDLTVPTMRMYAHRRNDLPRVVKRYQIGPVWRADRPGRGRFREFHQCDVDIIGSASPLADVEVLLALAAAIDDLGLGRFTIRLNSRRVIAGLMEAYGVPPDRQAEVSVVLDKADKIGHGGVAEALSGIGLPNMAAARLVADLTAQDWAAALRRRIAESGQGREGLAEVEAIAGYLRPHLTGGTIRRDPILARGLDYYTGPIFEFFADGGAGSIAGGGRYDDLAGMFLKDSVPVCGGSLGIERIMLLLSARDVTPTPAGADVYVTVWDEHARADGLRLLTELRAAGLSAEIDLDGGRIGKQMRGADERGCRFAVVQGPDEKAAGQVAIKDMTSGAQETVPESDATAAIKRLGTGPD
ncbi:MAG: histidine--tRNA ligase [Alphaproteobacteria bacterium]|nr:histidine--tRNA ligase [Alphaproteobacteria bacterium]MDP6515787.1 histidine--tRNA ligase [Alphaproteobacteria bacterium]